MEEDKLIVIGTIGYIMFLGLLMLYLNIKSIKEQNEKQNNYSSS